MRVLAACCIAWLATTTPGTSAQENYESWPLLRSTFPSTGGGGIVIKGYDPVITGGKCLTTFMAVEPGAEPKVYPNFIEFEAVAAQGGTLCQNGKWRLSTAAPPARRRSGCSSRRACSEARPELFRFLRSLPHNPEILSFF
jgi:hypothetical protein